jgi:DNA-binding response OmpR family regulator
VNSLVATQRILIIEDEENLAEALRYALEREGYEATAIGSGVGRRRR